MDDWIDAAHAAYSDLGLDDLPPRLRRNSLDYYYLSVWPPPRAMYRADSLAFPPRPASTSYAYIHLPFCSGVCSFCSYYVVVARQPDQLPLMEAYVDAILTHADQLGGETQLELTYLYMGGGTPSLLPPYLLERLLGGLDRRNALASGLMGTLEVHPELFEDRRLAREMLSVLRSYGITRLSIGYQYNDVDLLAATNRRHDATSLDFLAEYIREQEFLFNVDVMYGTPGQTIQSWARTLELVARVKPDSISTYFTFIDPGTRLWHQVARGDVVLPSHETIQTEHLLAQQYLESSALVELPNDFYSPAPPTGRAGMTPSLPSASNMIALGAGAYGYYPDVQFFNEFSIARYMSAVAAGRSPVWRARVLSNDESLRRDVAFSFKNAPHLAKDLFARRHDARIGEQFAAEFASFGALGLLTDDGANIELTPKGRLVVEEMAAGILGADPDGEAPRSRSEDALLDKHHFTPKYRAGAG